MWSFSVIKSDNEERKLNCESEKERKWERVAWKMVRI